MRKLLILDLDETLVHAREQPLNIPAEFRAGKYHVYRRPYLTEFLEECKSLFDLAIWTSATPEYAEEVVKHLFDNMDCLEFIWAIDRCTTVYNSELGIHYLVKDFKKLRKRGYSLQSVIVVDDSPEKHKRNYGNLIPVSPFMGDPHDDELMYLSRFLRKLTTVSNIRSIEKRNWRTTLR